jgi:DNA repair protein RadC
MDIKLLHEATLRAGRDKIVKRPVISVVERRCSAMSASPSPTSRASSSGCMFLDKKNQLIADEVMNRGTVDHAPGLSARGDAPGAGAVVQQHHHSCTTIPVGDPTPSRPDIDMTKQIVEAGKALKIAVHDHLVVGRDGVASFKALGLF